MINENEYTIFPCIWYGSIWCLNVWDWVWHSSLLLKQWSEGQYATQSSSKFVNWACHTPNFTNKPRQHYKAIPKYFFCKMSLCHLMLSKKINSHKLLLDIMILLTVKIYEIVHACIIYKK